MVTGYCLALAAIILFQRAVELLIARYNKAWAFEQGAKEYGQGHYPLFFLLHAGWLTGWVTEGIYIGSLDNWWYIWLALFLVAQLLRYWCIVSLGRFWNTRILVIPGAKAIRRGPYRYLRHPNYLAVALELAVVPLIFGGIYTAIIATAVNAALLLLIRIPSEEEALLFFY